ncbi:hypothetical protein GCM10010331_11150 [Streptomyces xanthochromogenes]|uniref:Uncharacterized protein n=1 Tax=Streptomyces xanthochromogenes TaxID=67384 RepID=A0ABQ2ZY23_9ACTN|nr:hypothetical protein GCM10010326_20230 [Streptomyces xanthochromogenes]GHB26677.1 hypothetical protein GCM10010331_11150 [Streptomyces xanthochromogenes]
MQLTTVRMRGAWLMVTRYEDSSDSARGVTANEGPSVPERDEGPLLEQCGGRNYWFWFSPR